MLVGVPVVVVMSSLLFRLMCWDVVVVGCVCEGFALIFRARGKVPHVTASAMRVIDIICKHYIASKHTREQASENDYRANTGTPNKCNNLP